LERAGRRSLPRLERNAQIDLQRSLVLKQATESLHVVSVPGGLECVGNILRFFHVNDAAA